jgi:hypothetical protein
MQKEYIAFIREIYRFCDENIGCEENIMFPSFINLWQENGCEEPSKRDLARFTSKIINRLIRKGTLIEDFEKRKFDTSYGFYKIFPHEKYVRVNNLIEKKMKLMR